MKHTVVEAAYPGGGQSGLEVCCSIAAPPVARLAGLIQPDSPVIAVDQQPGAFPVQGHAHNAGPSWHLHTHKPY